MGVRSHIGVHFVLKILLGAEGGWSHKTSWSYNAGTTVPLSPEPEAEEAARF